MQVTVEGLETAEQVERMRGIDIDYAQGFYFAAPLPASVIPSVVEGPGRR